MRHNRGRDDNHLQKTAVLLCHQLIKKKLLNSEMNLTVARPSRLQLTVLNINFTRLSMLKDDKCELQQPGKAFLRSMMSSLLLFFLLPRGLSPGAAAKRPPLSLFNYLIRLTCTHTDVNAHLQQSTQVIVCCTHFLRENREMLKEERSTGMTSFLNFWAV